MGEKKLKILCLHGYGYSGAYLKKRLQVWPSYILEKMDCVYIDAPFPTHDKPFPAYSWFESSAEDEDTFDRTFNESMAFIEETMVKYGPFDGVLGFSQGAYIAAALPGIQSQGVAFTKVEPIKFVMVISGGKLGGFRVPAPKVAENAFNSPIAIPSLHCFGENDLAKLTAIELLKSFVDPFVIYHSGGHEVPKLDDKGLKAMLSFFDKIQAIVPVQRIRSTDMQEENMNNKVEKKFKVLCIHGYKNSGAYLKKQIQVWPANVLEKMDFVFIDAPFPVHDKPYPAFSWFHASTEDAGKYNSQFNESIGYIEETMVEHGPFDGVIGFSQVLFANLNC